MEKDFTGIILVVSSESILSQESQRHLILIQTFWKSGLMTVR